MINKILMALIKMSVLLIAYSPSAIATVFEPNPSGISVTQAFDQIVGPNSAISLRYLIQGVTIGVALIVTVYAIYDSFKAMTDGQIEKKTWIILVIRALSMLMMLNILISL
ncbi:DUF3262 family protein [Vibrio cyclitrophicus]|uniref:DUF3262 family protein n=1 Tax=Vibrio cyclitrophicus TaxID=47951 RepID=UPI0032E5015B